ncbi:baseplate J/gp47 family protein [Psychrobacillus sp. NEAU-3TGS]|uniref:baseplate J/gp47 family protein n=1 Tax=Psychrobacillus sp. NEAU-3TGS TaxID=2995412 RepID=UPI002495F387|nr:baseplate J/gp47 family protein [Psychrobacillus sp. NEAU-3TGS]MDI2588036.1 baseplate J/gp47 family protein [Psychrobacillus sp. NEAU-3TGS]
MYEHMTYDFILQRMLDRVTNDVDKREGSIVYDALAPAAAELTQAYIAINTMSDTVSIDTAVDYELTELAFQNGVFRKGATKAILRGKFNINVPLGFTFSSPENTFVVREKISDGIYKLESELPGLVGNEYLGEIIPSDYLEGLTSATLTDIIAYGVGEENDDQLREKLRRKILYPDQDGNVAQYIEWADAYDGVGAVKVFPLFYGGNTVKVAISDRSFQVADSLLIDSFQHHLDPGGLGLGNGVAPIGSKVTVTGGVKKDINISVNIVLAEGYTEPEGVAQAISNYLASVTFVKNKVSYMRMAVTIIDTPSIADLNDFRMNGGIEDVELVGDEIPMINSINLTVVSG